MMSLFRELWRYFKARKRYWLLPILLLLAAAAALIVLVESTAVAPFVYTLF